MQQISTIISTEIHTHGYPFNTNKLQRDLQSKHPT